MTSLIGPSPFASLERVVLRLVLCLLLIPTLVFAQRASRQRTRPTPVDTARWRHFIDADSANAFFDKETIQRTRPDSSAPLQAWIRIDFERPLLVGGKRIARSLAQYGFDCTRSRYAKLAGRLTFADGYTEPEEYTGTWHSAVPESLEEKALRAVCDHVAFEAGPKPPDDSERGWVALGGRPTDEVWFDTLNLEVLARQPLMLRMWERITPAKAVDAGLAYKVKKLYLRLEVDCEGKRIRTIGLIAKNAAGGGAFSHYTEAWEAADGEGDDARLVLLACYIAGRRLRV